MKLYCGYKLWFGMCSHYAICWVSHLPTTIRYTYIQIINVTLIMKYMIENIITKH